MGYSIDTSIILISIFSVLLIGLFFSLPYLLYLTKKQDNENRISDKTDQNDIKSENPNDVKSSNPIGCFLFLTITFFSSIVGTKIYFSILNLNPADNIILKFLIKNVGFGLICTIGLFNIISFTIFHLIIRLNKKNI